MITLLKNILALFILFSGTLSLAQSNGWAQRAGGSYWDDVAAIHIGEDQNILITGMFQNTADFGSASITSWAYQDGFVAKYDPQGNVLWVNGINGNDDQVWGADVTSDANNNVYVTGYFYSPAIYFTPSDSIEKNPGSSSDIFLVKYNSNGVFQWAKSGKGTYSLAKSITCDAQDNVIISGSYNTEITFSETVSESSITGIYLVKYDSQGNLIWLKSGTSNSQCWFNDLASDESNNIYATGKVSNTIKFGANTVTNHGGDDMSIAKFNSSGDLMWMEIVGNSNLASTTSNNYDCGNSIAVDQNGDVFVGGALVDSVYIDEGTIVELQFAAVLKYDNNGTQQWINRYGNQPVDIVNDIALDSNGDPYVIGNYSGEFSVGPFQLPTQSADTRAFMAKFNTGSGEPIWAEEHGTTSTGDILGVGIEINPVTHAVYSTGEFANSFSYGGNTVYCMGGWDMFLTKGQGTLSMNGYPENSKGLLVYPNPATSKVTLSLPIKDFNGAKVSIYSLNGQLVLENQLNNQQRVLDVDSLEPGNYIIHVRSKGEEYRQKLIIL